MSGSAPASGRRWLLYLVPPLLWFVHFSLLYGLGSFGPSAGLPAGSVMLASWLATGAATVSVVGWWLILRKDAGSIGDWLAALSLMSISLQILVLALVPSA